ncbi:sigma-70 family RNA polymerase sigma factor [Thermoflexus sp.]|uniref:sigma-70 family RNA polymerase sigma factor n=1 Tax=Thermoflexus sp. TaxID=1969742 RepID=UPI0017E0C7E5|nr:sigma-70 family RNA polymerase sigma factor [Thermoflexus sp.]
MERRNRPILPDEEEELENEELWAEPWEEEAPLEELDLEPELDEETSLPVLGELAEDRDLISLYFREVTDHPLLTAEEEKELATRMARGREAARRLARDGNLPPEVRQRLERLVEEGRQAREKLITSNFRLVISVAKKYQGLGVPLLDLIQEGNLGLMKAVERFDPKRGRRFSTYATWWIRQAITRALAMQARTIRLPIHAQEQLRKAQRIAHQIEQEAGRPATPEEVAERLGMETDKVEWLWNAARPLLSLEEPMDDEGETTLEGAIRDVESPAPDEVVADQLLREQIEELLNELPSRHARVLRLRYGFEDGRSYTLEEVAQRFGLSRERIRQIEAEALRYLRKQLKVRQMREFLKAA